VRPNSTPALRLATAADAESIRDLLRRNRLPVDDLAASRAEFVVACDGERIIGAGALERFGSAALLRSVAVEARWRGSGTGGLMVRDLERRARETGVSELFLLTETAVGFFAHHGYAVVDRNCAPEGIRASAQFRSLCPASAVCMRKAPP
jgi:amino-acid N-acetyltransferase